MKLKEEKTQDTYITLSETFQNIGDLFDTYFSTLYENGDIAVIARPSENGDIAVIAQPSEKGDIAAIAQPSEKGRMIASCLNRICLGFLHFRESIEGQKLLEGIVRSEYLLLKRIPALSDIIIKPTIYDVQPRANNITKQNILEMKQLLESHKMNIETKVYEEYGQGLRQVQKAINLYKKTAQELNSYLIQQNRKEAQTADGYPNNGELTLIFTKDGKLNIKALE
jgi:hypothetical protein